MNRNFIKPLTLAVFDVTVLLASAAPPFGWSARAQQTSDVRKVKTKVVPEYPDLARKLKIKGIARVQLTITAQGAVSEVKELGGNPVLLQSLVQAVKQWKYEPAKSESVVELKYEVISRANLAIQNGTPVTQDFQLTAVFGSLTFPSHLR